MEDHGDIFMSFSVVNFKLIKIISNQLEYLFLLIIYNYILTTSGIGHYRTILQP